MVNLLRYIWKKNYTGQKKITRAPPVAPVTNIRYAHNKQYLIPRYQIYSIRPQGNFQHKLATTRNECIIRKKEELVVPAVDKVLHFSHKVVFGSFEKLSIFNRSSKLTLYESFVLTLVSKLLIFTQLYKRTQPIIDSSERCTYFYSEYSSLQRNQKINRGC